MQDRLLVGCCCVAPVICSPRDSLCVSKARVMCLGKYALAFLPPDSNTMIIYFTLPISSSLSLSLSLSLSFSLSLLPPLLVTVNDCLAN